MDYLIQSRVICNNINVQFIYWISGLATNTLNFPNHVSNVVSGETAPSFAQLLVSLLLYLLQLFYKSEYPF